MTHKEKKGKKDDILGEILGEAVIEGEGAEESDLDADSVTIDVGEDIEGGNIFQEGEFLVYDSAEAEKSLKSVSGKEEDEVVIVEDVESGAGEVSSITPIEWSAEEWEKVVKRIEKDAEFQMDPAISAHMFAEAGRIQEKRLGNSDSALILYDKALKKDPRCLPALQGKRRILLKSGKRDEAIGILKRENEIAQDAQDDLLKWRIESAISSLKFWFNQDSSVAQKFSDLFNACPNNPYLAFMEFSNKCLSNDPAGAGEILLRISEMTRMKPIRRILSSAAGIAFEMSQRFEDAQNAYRRAIGESKVEESDMGAVLGLWRMSIRDGKWAEAENYSNISLEDPDSTLTTGHRFFLASQLLLIPQKLEEAESLFMLIPESPASLILRFLSVAGRDREKEIEYLKKLEGKIFGSDALKAALQWILSTKEASSSSKIEWLKKSLNCYSGFILPELELLKLLSSSSSEEDRSFLLSIINGFLSQPDKLWLAIHGGLTLIEQGNDKDGREVLYRVLKQQKDENLLWVVGLYNLANQNEIEWLNLMSLFSGIINDSEVLTGVRLLQADMIRAIENKKDSARDIIRNLITDGVTSVFPYRLLAMDDESCRDTVIFNFKSIMEMLDAPKGEEAVLPVMMLMGEGIFNNAQERISIYRKILEKRPGYLPAFCALRRELLSGKRYKEYLDSMEEFFSVAGRREGSLFDNDRLALLVISNEYFHEDNKIDDVVQKYGNDPFFAIHFSNAGALPSISASAIEQIANMLPPLRAQSWWFEAARKWMGLNRQRMMDCIKKLEDEKWKRCGDFLIEANSWLEKDWTGVTERLLESLRNIPEGVGQNPVLSKVAYIDLMLRQDLSIGFAEVESLVQNQGNVPIIELRMLLKHILREGRYEEVLPILRSLCLSAGDSEEARAWAWIGFRFARDDDMASDMIYYELLKDTEKLAGDVPLLLLKSILARKRNDYFEIAKILETLILSFEGDREQGALMWVIALLLADKDLDSALNMVKESVAKLPLNPGAAYLLERIAELKEDWPSAAMGAGVAGRLFKEPQHMSNFLLKAASIYKEKMGEIGWATQCYEEVLSMDPLNRDAFEGLKSYCVETGSWDRLCSLIESRILMVQDDYEKQSLRMALSEAYEKAGRLEDAIKIDLEIVDAEPESPRALQTLAQHAISAGQWETAAASLQQFLALPVSDEEKVETFMKLGNIYIEQIPDLQRAIHCYEQVNEIGPLDLEVVEKLANLYFKAMDWEKGIKQVQILYENAEDTQQKVKWLVMAGKFFEEGAKDLKRAEKTYESARAMMPTAHEPVVSMIKLYRKINDEQALKFLIHRSIGDLKVFQQKNPDDMTIYHTIMHILSEAGDRTGTRIIGTLLNAFMEILPDETLALEKAGGEISWQGGSWITSPELEEHLLPTSITSGFKMLMQKLESIILKSLTVLPEKYGISSGTKLQKRSPEDEAILEEVAGWFGVKKFQVHLVDLVPNMLAILPDSPATLVIGEPLFRQLTRNQKRYVFAWGCKIVSSGMLPLYCLSEDELAGLWVAVIQQFEPSFFIAGVPAESSSKFTYKLQKNMSKKIKEELIGIALECSSDPNIQPQKLYSALLNYADRAALLGCGSIKEAINFHWRLHVGGHDPVTSGAQIQDVLSESEVVAMLCEFIISGGLAKCLDFYPGGI